MQSSPDAWKHLSLEEKRELADLLLLKMLKRAEKDPCYFICNFLYTFNPKVEPYHFEFKLFPFQYDLVWEIKKAIETGDDIFIEKCREMGATYVMLAVILWFWRFQPGSNFLIGSRKQDFVDNTGGSSGEVSNKEESLFGKLEYFLHRMDPAALPRGFSFEKHMTFMSLQNPENGNVIGGESSNANFSRGGRQKAILMDEFAFWDNDSAAWGSTADTTNCRIVVTTPGIRPNTKAKRLRFGIDGEKIKVITLGYHLDPRKTQEWLDRERERRSSEDFAREIMIDWEGSIKGRVYPEIKLAELGHFPYDPAWTLYCSGDFGYDGTAFGWYQINPYNGKLRVVETYKNFDHPIQFYFPLFKQPVDSFYPYKDTDLEAFNAVKTFKKAIHYGDPDVAKRSYAARDAKTTRRALSDIEVYVQTAPASNDFLTRREKTKVWLQKGIEVNDTPRNRLWLEDIQNARYPDREETSQATGPVTLPIHDSTSHHRTQLEYLCVNLEDVASFTPKPETTHDRIMAKLQGRSGEDVYVDEVLGEL